MKKLGILLCILLLSTQITACQSKVKTSKTITYTPEDQVNEENMKELKAGSNNLAYQLFNQIQGQKNVIISPYSLTVAISMLDNAVSGNTKKEIEQVLGISDLVQWNNEVSLYLNVKQKKDAKIYTANSLWLSKNLTYIKKGMKQYKNIMNEKYSSELYQVDFKNDYSRINQQMNQWVSKHTNQMIQQIPNSTSGQTALVLLNAVYFHGKWNVPFDENISSTDMFYGINGSSNVTMMNMQGVKFKYYEEGELKGIQLPYGEGNIVMNIILPMDESNNVETIFNSMTTKEKEDFYNSLNESEEVSVSELSIPKFTVEYNFADLKKDLVNLGMKETFTSNADFSTISKNLYVDSIGHVAKIEVDEEGSRASAVTEIVAGDTGVAPSKSEVTFIANHPFIYMIQDTRTGMILFLGEKNQ